MAQPRSLVPGGGGRGQGDLAPARLRCGRVSTAVAAGCGARLPTRGGLYQPRRPAGDPDQPAVGGTPASVIVTVQLDDLLKRAGIAQTSDGTQLSSDQLLRIADEADIWPTIIDQDGVPLALGRTQRLASRGQTMALIARDGGCSFPGCTHPASWCDRHHILDWILGGSTDLNNLTLLRLSRESAA